MEEGETKTFYSDKGAEAFQNHLAKKGFVEERGFKQLYRHSRRKSSNGAGRR